MAKLKAIQAANKSISSKQPTAVFVGATSGIGLGAIEALVKNTTSPRVFVIGRSQSKFAPSLANLQQLNASATISFIEAQVSQLKEVHRVCKTIQAQESAIDILWLSQGGLSFADNELTSEGLNAGLAIKYYSRILFMHELVSLLEKSTDPRIVSILSAGSEGPVNLHDFGLLQRQNHSFFPALKQGVTMMSLAMKEMSQHHPRISFIHTNPGMVSTDVHSKWADTMTGYLTPLSWLMRWVMIPLFHRLGWTPEQAGEIGLYECTNQRYGADSRKNFFRLWDNAEETTEKPLLLSYEEDGTQGKIWEHTLGVFDRVLAQQ